MCLLVNECSMWTEYLTTSTSPHGLHVYFSPRVRIRSFRRVAPEDRKSEPEFRRVALEDRKSELEWVSTEELLVTLAPPMVLSGHITPAAMLARTTRPPLRLGQMDTDINTTGGV